MSRLGVIGLSSLIGVAVWAIVVFAGLGRRRVQGDASVYARLLLWIVGIGCCAVQVVSPRSVVVNGLTLRSAALSGLPMRLAQLVTLAGVGVSLFIILTEGLFARPGSGAEHRRRPGTSVVACLIAVYGSAVAAALISGNGGLNAALVIGPLTIIALYMSPRIPTANLVTQLRIILRLFTYGSLLALIIVPHWALRPSVGAARDYFQIGGQLSGVVLHPNVLGPLAAAAVILEVASLERRRGWQIHAVAAATVLVLSQSRTSIVAVVLAASYLRTRTRSWRPVRLLLTLVLGVSALAAIVAPRTLSPATTLVSTASEGRGFNGRTIVWTYVRERFGENPVIGYGPNLFPQEQASRTRASSLPAWAVNAHNQVLQTAGTSGLLGLAALAAFILAIVRSAWEKSLQMRGLASGLVVLFLAQCATEVPLEVNSRYFPVYFLLLALVAILIAPDVSGESYLDSATGYPGQTWKPTGTDSRQSPRESVAFGFEAV